MTGSIAPGSNRASTANGGSPGELLPPRELQDWVGLGGPAVYKATGNEFLGYLIDLCGLQPGDAMLDVGCGSGRMALPLTSYLNREGRYAGFDVAREAIAWCTENISGSHPNFDFKVADVQSIRYNPKGKYKPSDFRFPYPDESFDVVLLASVFTHMLPADVKHYMYEIVRVLKPGGRSLITFFLLNDMSSALSKEGMGQIKFEHEIQGARTANVENPEAAIAYPEDSVRDLYGQCGLEIREPLRYGMWCGRPDGMSGQDVVIAVKAANRNLPAQGVHMIDSKASQRMPRMNPAAAEQYIASLYTTVLKRDPRPEEFAHWVSVAAALPPEQVYFAFVNSKEYKLQQEKSVPTMFPPGHYYSPIVDPSTIGEYVDKQYQQEPGDIKGIHFDEDAMVRFWKENAEFIKNTPFSEHDDGKNRYYYNNIYPYGDAITLRAMIAHFKPKNVIEVGSGLSSACMLDTVDHVGLSDFTMTCIDPYADRLRSRLREEDHSRVEIIEGLVQDVPVSTFSKLKENDILFIDSTHVLKTASDVHYELFSILPSLNKGVLIHFHDIQYPFEYPRGWLFQNNNSWNEIYALRAFLMFNSAFEVVFWNGLFAHRQRELVHETNPLFLKNPGGSIWLRTRSADILQTQDRAMNAAAEKYSASLRPALTRNESVVEEVRLLIWDLDDTYWRGTLTEGGITEYVREHHDIVIKLAQRGIMSSICSKNDEVKVMEILKREGIADYFIFPSISWGPKGTRLASIIEAVQLRPANVMFIDDNHLNRAEAVDLIPDLQIEDEAFVTRVLSDPRFKGKDDSRLSRLAQYKVLEQRKQDEAKAEGNNEEFLRGCDVRVYIEYDVERHIDRAVELINRTNQLNFTKVRLPEDPEKARAELSALLNDEFRQSGLIRVVDKYGDYGFVGFYMVTSGVVDRQNGRLVQRLDHFCFSCRTLGMLVEAWVYDYLQRPRIKIVGEVLTDITTVARPIDWIRLASADGNGMHTNAAQKIFPEIRVHGGCEANAVAHYLTPYADHTIVTGNFHAGTTFCRVNGSTLLLSACDRSEPSFESEADALGIPRNMFVTDYFQSAPAGAAFVFGGQLDRPGSLRYRHNQHGWEICVEPHGLYGVDLVSTVREDILARVAGLNFPDAAKRDIAKVALHIHENYQSVEFSQERDLSPAMEEIFSRVPLGSKLVLITDHIRVRATTGEVKDWPGSAAYHAAITGIAAPYPFVRVVSFKDHVRNEDEVNVGGNHYHRMVYLRMAEAIIEELKVTPPKTAELRRTAVSVVPMQPDT